MKGDCETISRLMEEKVRLEQRSVMLDRLLFEVERKFSGETRFDTALRYIREAEARANETGQAQSAVPNEPLTDHMAALIDSAYYEGAKLALIKADESIQVAREWLAGGCNGRRQAALAILRHAPPPPDVQGWKPIETCPADTVVLLYSPWRHFSNPATIEVREFRNTRSGTEHSWATHWMPLPAPPQTKEGGL